MLARKSIVIDECMSVRVAFVIVSPLCNPNRHILLSARTIFNVCVCVNVVNLIVVSLFGGFLHVYEFGFGS